MNGWIFPVWLSIVKPFLQLYQPEYYFFVVLECPEILIMGNY